MMAAEVLDMKEVLLQLVAEIQDLRANVDCLAQRVVQGVSLADAQDAKKLAIQRNRAAYEKLRQKIADLP